MHYELRYSSTVYQFKNYKMLLLALFFIIKKEGYTDCSLGMVVKGEDVKDFAVLCESANIDTLKKQREERTVLISGRKNNDGYALPFASMTKVYRKKEYNSVW